MQPVKLGIIGCGLAAKDLHWPALQKLKNLFEITVVCNHTEQKAKDFADMVGNVDYVLDYNDLLKRDDVEAVDIILPIHLNCQVTQNSLKAGKHVIVEKPLAGNLDDAKLMTNFPQKYSQVMMIAENFRYRPLFYRVKHLIDEGNIGKVYAVDWNIFMHVTPETNKYARTPWRIDHQHVGGFITDGAVHNIAVFRFLFGEIFNGFAQVKSVNPGIGELDTFSLQFSTEQNIQGTFKVYISVGGFLENRMLIFGDQGTIVIINNKIIIKKDGQRDKKITVRDDGGYQAQFIDFYNAIRKEKPVFSTFQEGYNDLAVLIGGLKSAGKKKVSE